MTELFLIIVLSFLGALLGCLSGLVPGLHVNNLALILVSLSPSLLFLLHNPPLVCLIIVTISIAHTFVNLIPGTFLGAPDENALSILPAHKLLLAGKGYTAIFLSSIGSFGAIVFCFAALIPFRFIIGEPLNLYLLLSQAMVFILIAITIILIYSEHAELPYRKGIVVEDIRLRERSGRDDISKLKFGSRCAVHGLITRRGKSYFIEREAKKVPIWCGDNKKLLEGATATVEGEVKRVKSTFSRTLGVGLAIFIFVLSGIFGIIIFRLNVSSPLKLPSTPLFPAFAGLFGISILIFSLKSISALPEQKIQKPKLSKKESFISIFTGSCAGSLLGFLPGITSGHATVLSMLARKSKKEEQTLLTLSAVNTSYSFFCLAALFIILKPRNGTTIAVSQLIGIEQWSAFSPPPPLVYLLLGALIASAVAYYANLWLGKKFVKLFSKLNYKKLVLTIIVLITIMAFLFTGFTGVLVLLVGTGIGLLAPSFGVRRSHCMGVLLLPIIINLAG